MREMSWLEKWEKESVVGMNRASLAFCWAVDKYFQGEQK
jgi:hypothetical protein